jgi:hypothetical protein
MKINIRVALMVNFSCCLILHGVAQVRTIDDIIRGHRGDFNAIVQEAEAFFLVKGKDGPAWKEYMRWRFMVENHLDSNGRVPNFEKRNQQALNEYIKNDPVPKSGGDSIALQAGVSAWTPLGQPNPTIEEGRNQNGVGSIRCLEWSGNNIWAGAPGGGMWFGSYLGGSSYSWSARTDGLPNIAITDIEIAATNSSIMYALTGAVGNASGYRSTGVIKSTNSGATWALTGLNFADDGDEKGYRLLCNPNNSNIVWAATTDGMYRTTDGGANWARTTYYVPGGNTQVEMTGSFFEIVYKPGSTTTMYATGSNYFYISTDGGATFERINRTDAGLPTTGTRIQIAVAPSNSSVVYLLYASDNSDNYKALYKSTNSGSTFTLQSTTPNILGEQAWRNIAIAVSPTNSTHIYVGGLDVYKSTNSGETWTLIADQSTPDASFFCHADIFELYCTDTYLYAATDGGVYRMTRSTDDWVDLNQSMQTGQIYRFSLDPSASAAYTLNGLQDNGTYRNSSIQYLNIGGADGMETAIRPSSTSTVYVSSQSGPISRSDDGGSTRTSKFSPTAANNICACGESSRWVTNFVLRPGNDQHIYVGYESVWFSTTQGDNGWTRITPAFANPIHNIAFAPSNNTIMYATDGAAVARYNLSNGTWTRTTITGNLPAMTAMTRVAVDPNDATRVLVSVGGYTSTRKVYETFNADAASPTWTNITRNLPNVPVNTVIMDDDLANTIYIGTDIGVFVTNDNRTNWQMFTNGLPTTRVYDLEINTAASPDLIFAATFGRGVFKAETYTGCVASATLSGTVEGLKYSETSSGITSTQLIQGGTGTSVAYNAGATITLTPGFQVLAGSTFQAYIQGCTSAANPPRPLKAEKKQAP